MKYLMTCACALALTMAAIPARAEIETGRDRYIGNGGGLALPKNTGVSGAATGATDYGFSSGGYVMLGYRPDWMDSGATGMRVELEGGYHALGLDSVRVGAVTNPNPKGDVSLTTLMANAYYDIHTGTPFTPYIGGGIGGAMVKFPSGNGFGNTDSTDTTFAYQFMAGVSYAPDFMPNSEFFAGYRFLGASSPEYDTAGGRLSLDSLETHNIEGGFRFNF